MITLGLLSWGGLHAQLLNGTYLIGSGGDYATVSEAIDSLTNKGISGPVTFQIKDGTYNEQLIISGWQYNYPIEFIGNSNDSMAVTIEFNANLSNNFLLKIDSSKNLRFKYIHFKATDDTFANVVVFSKGSKNIVFEHCVFENNCSTYSYDGQNLVMAPPVYSANGGPDTTRVSDSLTFRNNRFIGGYKALQLGGCYDNTQSWPNHPIYKYSQHNVIQNNSFENFADLGIEIIAGRYNNIEANRLISNKADATAIEQEVSSVNSIQRNYILLQNNGSGIVSEDFYQDPSNYLDIWNNVVFIFGPAQVPMNSYYGIMIKNITSISARIYHNTVSIYSSLVEAAMALSSATGVEIKQNIFAHYRQGYFISVDASSSSYDIDRNDYYSNGYAIASINGTLLEDTSQISSYELDENPIFVLPILQSLNDPRPLNCELDNMGTSSLVTTDYYGNSRDTINDIGAVEFTANAITGGTYTIGQNGDFTSLGDALQVVSKCVSNLTDTLTLLLTDATYYESPIVIDSLGVAAYPIVIKPAPGVNASIIIQVTTNIFSTGITLNNAQNIIFDGSNKGSNTQNLTIMANGSDATSCINITSYSRSIKDIVIKNCQLMVNGNNESMDGVIAFGYDARNIRLENNTISGGKVGIGNYGDADFIWITKNKIIGVRNHGIRLNSVKNTFIQQNVIRNIFDNQISGNEVSGINVWNSYNVVIERNLIDTIIQSGYNVSGIYVNTDTANFITIRNNIIRHVAGDNPYPYDNNYWPSGIRVEINDYMSNLAPNTIKIYHNSIELKATADTNRLGDNGTSVGILAYSPTSVNGKMDIRNNLIINRLEKQNSATNTRNTALYFDGVKPGVCSNNIYHTEGADNNLIGAYNSDDETVSSSMYHWRGLMSNSLNLDDRSFAIRPLLDTTHLKPDASFAFANNTAVAGLVAEDFGGNSRDAQKPDIGAWEYNGVPTLKSKVLSDTTWNGTLALVDTLMVPAGKTLSINPGTNIQIADSMVLGYRIPLLVQGKITANGNNSNPIQFIPITRSRWGGIHIESNTAGSTLSYLHLLADTLTGNANRDTALTIIDNPGITIDHLTLDTNTYVGIKTVNSKVLIENSAFSPKFLPYFMDFEGGQIHIKNSNFTLNESPYIYYGLMMFNKVDSARVDSCQFINNTTGNVPELFAVSDTGKIYFTRNRITKYGSIKVRENFTGTLWIDKNRYFHPKEILQHNSSSVIMTNNLVYADSTDTSSFSWIGLDGNYATKRLNLKFLNNTWFRKGGNDSNARFYVNTSNTNDTLIIKNSIFYGFNNLVSGSGATVISHNAYSPEAGYNNNIDASGLKFKDTTSENSLDLALRYNSTGINGGDPAVNINLYPDTLDMAGNSRLYNDTIDMGAFEFIPLKITTQPLSVTVCEGDSASFVLNTNFAPETYQWQTSTDGLNWTSAGNNQNTYLIPSATITNGDTTITYIRCIVMTDGFENDTSNVAMLTVNPLPRKTLISNNDTQTVCIGTSIGSIIYSTVGVNGVSVTGLPSGVNNSFNNDTLTISSTPDTSGTFNYTVTFTGGCGNITDTGTIIVKPNMTISLTSTPGSNNQTVCVNSPISVITYSTTGATGATVSGLPSGVTGIWASNVVTISGTPDTSGTFNYTVTLTDGCGSASASGMLRVNDTISLLATVEPATTLTRGKITLTASGGDGNYSYSLDNSNFQTSNVFDNLLAGNYPAYVKDNSGCNASVANIRVDSIPSPCKASFSVSVDTTQRKVTFTNHSVAAMVYYWRFGDGITSNTFEPTHTYSSEGTYTACLSVYNNSQGCVSDTCMVINIYANLANRAVKSVFTYNHDSIDNRTLHFVNQSDNANGYYWIFGDGSYSTAESPSHTYLQPGTYRVCLASADTVNRKKDSYCMTVIAGNPTCTALADFQFVVDSTHQTRFFNTSTGTYHKVYWDFGDGEVSVNQNPTHQYEQPGSYNVVLTLFDTIGGCMNSSQKLVEVGYSPCRAAIEYFVDASNKTMWLSSNSIGNISEYLWQLDQGATLGGPSGSLTVPTAGVYNVTLSIYSDIDNCSDQVTEKIQVGSATCNATFSYLVDSLTQKTYFYGGQSAEGTRYYWLFGDGSYSTQTNPVHQYRQVGLYTASLTIFNPTTQCMDYFEQTIVIGGQGSDCEANFVYFPSNTNVQQIRFRDRSNAKGSIVNYIWDFGDGTWSTLKNPVHTFNKQGLYNICLSITNSNGISNMSCQTIRVGANANDLPKANFTYQVDPDSLTVYLQNTSSGQYSLLQWQLGDGYSTTDSNPIYTYSQAGLYLVSLRVSDNTYTSYRYRLLNVGLTDTFAVKFAYIVNQYSKKAGGYPVDFIGAGLGDEVRLKWNFGDGNTDTTSNSPTHVYADTGTYQVCLTMSDPITGQAATYCEPITAQSLCQSDTIKPTALCKSITVYLNSSGVVDITPLDIDNGSSDACGIASRILSKTHFTQSNLGNNTVTLTVADAMGNSASCNAIVNVQKGTNIDNYTPIELAVYPNPFAKLLYVHLFLEQTDQVEITLTDLAGKRVKTLEKANQQAGEKLYLFDMSDIRNGSYILQVKTLKGLLKQRVVIKN